MLLNLVGLIKLMLILSKLIYIQGRESKLNDLIKNNNFDIGLH